MGFTSCAPHRSRLRPHHHLWAQQLLGRAVPGQHSQATAHSRLQRSRCAVLSISVTVQAHGIHALAGIVQVLSRCATGSTRTVSYTWHYDQHPVHGCLVLLRMACGAGVALRLQTTRRGASLCAVSYAYNCHPAPCPRCMCTIRRSMIRLHPFPQAPTHPHPPSHIKPPNGQVDADLVAFKDDVAAMLARGYASQQWAADPHLKDEQEGLLSW
jgi:hypothetical protein